MASSEERVRYIAGQLAAAGNIRYRKMFGEYGLYLDDKFFATVEDDRLCLKMTEAGKELLGEPEIVSPHEGAFYFWVKDLTDPVFLAKLARATCDALPAKKPRKRGVSARS